MMKNQLPDPKDVKKSTNEEATIHSDETMVCSSEFPEGCVETEMDVSKAEKKDK